MGMQNVSKDELEALQNWSNKKGIREAIEQHKEKHQIGILLKHLREKEEISQRKLSEISGVTQPAIARIEGNTSTILPRLDLLTKLFCSMGYRLTISAEKLSSSR